MKSTTRLFVLALAVLAPVCTTWAEPDKPEYLDVKVSIQKVKQGDRQVDAVRVMLEDTEIVSPIRGLFTDTPCEVDYKIEIRPGGFDVKATVSNRTDQPQRRPDFQLSAVNTGTKLTYLDSRTLGHIHPIELGSTYEHKGKQLKRFLNWRMQYPDDMYAPVVAAWNSTFAVGVALIYDPWTVRHDINGFYATEFGKHFGSIRLGFGLHSPVPKWRNPPVPPKVLLESGQKAEYRFTVRFSKPDRWLDSLEPYREYFVKRFGKVTYKRDLRPVFGEPTGLTKFVKENENPRGYSPKARLDLVGWAPYVDLIKERAISKGYRRVMIWCPSGLYRVGANYPPEFMTEWPEKLVETLPVLMDLKKQGVTIGMWWGRSSQVSGGWNTGKMWERDVTKPADMKAAWDELDLAARRKIDEIGLDAFKYVPIWHRYDYMKTMKKRYPDMFFITESADCDIMHTLAATFMTWKRQPQAPVLADWLVPGHESWIQLYWQAVNQDNVDRIVGWKCVPVTMSRAVEHDTKDFEKR